MNKYQEESEEAQRRNREILASTRKCFKKKGYLTKEEGQIKGSDLYLCPICGLWHRYSLKPVWVSGSPHKPRNIRLENRIQRKKEEQAARKNIFEENVLESE